MHRRPQDYEFFKRLNPSVFKIMDGGTNDYQWAKDNLPASLIIARDWALSEQHSDMLADPFATGQRHAREWNEHQKRLGFDKATTLILGINEPHIWEAGVADALRRYTITLCDEANVLGLRVGAMQLSVGWPNNNGPDTPPDWSPFHGVEAAILRGRHALVCHEYWADQGPLEMWGWWGGRSLKCPWNVPIIIGECGIDMYVKNGASDKQKRGWRTNVSPERYAVELAEYTSWMSADPRFVGNCVFASDFASHDWWSFDIEPAYNAILSTPVPVAPARPPVDIHLPAIGTGPKPIDPTVDPTPQHDEGKWQRSREFVRRWEGGYQNNPADIGNWTGCEVGKGQNKGTKFGISACSYPQLDIANLTMEQADAIYFREYWQASGADKLPWPYCLLAFDTAVLHGVGTAKKWVEEVGDNPYAFAAKRLQVYTKLKNWKDFGAGWTNRTADLLWEAGKE